MNYSIDELKKTVSQWPNFSYFTMREKLIEHFPYHFSSLFHVILKIYFLFCWILFCLCFYELEALNKKLFLNNPFAFHSSPSEAGKTSSSSSSLNSAAITNWAIISSRIRMKSLSLWLSSMKQWSLNGGWKVMECNQWATFFWSTKAATGNPLYFAAVSLSITSSFWKILKSRVNSCWASIVRVLSCRKVILMNLTNLKVSMYRLNSENLGHFALTSNGIE